jgi:hypothetical protein
MTVVFMKVSIHLDLNKDLGLMFGLMEVLIRVIGVKI